MMLVAASHGNHDGIRRVNKKQFKMHCLPHYLSRRPRIPRRAAALSQTPAAATQSGQPPGVFRIEMSVGMSNLRCKHSRYTSWRMQPEDLEYFLWNLGRRVYILKLYGTKKMFVLRWYVANVLSTILSMKLLKVLFPS